MIESQVTAKVIGIIAGTFLAIVFIPPRSIYGFIRRTSAALVFGWVFGHLVLEYFKLPPTDENTIAAWAIAAFCSWWLMGALKKVAEKFSPPTQ